MSTTTNDDLQRVMRKLARAYRNGSGCRLSRQDVRDLMDAALARQTDGHEPAAPKPGLEKGAAPGQPSEGAYS